MVQRLIMMNLLRERITFLFTHSPKGLAVNFLMSLITFFILRTYSDRTLLLFWISSIYLITIGRIVFAKIITNRILLYKEPESNMALRENQFLAGTILSGIAWGSLPLIPVLHSTLNAYLYIAFVLGAMVIGSIPVLSISLKIAASFAAFTLLPFTVKLFMLGSPMFFSMGIMVFIFFAVFFFFTRSLNRMQINSIDLKTSNSTLISDLQEANEKLEDRLAKQIKIAEGIQEAYEFQKSIMDNSLSGIYVLDLDGNFLRTNIAAEKITGYSRDELFGLPYASLIPDSDVLAVNHQFEKILHEGATVHEFHTRLIRKNGAVINIMFTASPITRAGTTIGVVGSAKDVTIEYRFQLIEKARLNMLEMLASGHTLNEILESIVLNTEKVSEDMICSILLVDDSGTRLKHGAAPSLPDFYNEAIDGLFITENMGSCGTAAYKRQRIISPDIINDPNWTDQRSLVLKAGLKACWSQPIVGENDQLLGTFAIYYRTPRTPEEYDIKVIEECSQIVRIAIERKKMENEMLLQNKALSVLFNTSSVLIQADEPEKLFEKIADSLAELVEFHIEKQMKIFRKTDEGLELMYENVPYADSEESMDICYKVKSGECLCGKALEQKEVLVSFHSGADKEHTRNRRNSPHGHIIIPLIGRDGINGILCLYTKPEPQKIGDNIFNMFKSLGRQIGMSLETTALMEELRARSIYDPLTGLSNRYHMNLVLEKWIPRAKRGDLPLSVVLLDIDFFKEYNDTNGHRAGDHVLSEVARILEEEIREEDMAVRYGGEEFLIILPDTPKEEAGDVAERIRSAIETSSDVTISAGVASLRPGDDFETALETADTCLYKAKRSGRNRIVIKDDSLQMKND